MLKKSRQKLKYLESNKKFVRPNRRIFYYFWMAIIETNNFFLEGESPTLRAIVELLLMFSSHLILIGTLLHWSLFIIFLHKRLNIWKFFLVSLNLMQSLLHIENIYHPFSWICCCFFLFSLETKYVTHCA